MGDMSVPIQAQWPVATMAVVEQNPVSLSLCEKVGHLQVTCARSTLKYHLGKEYIARISSALSVSQTLQDGANQFFTLAASYNFIQGRRIKSVAAVALYLACRMQTQNHNHHMLIDFADVLDVSNSRTLSTITPDAV